MASTKRDHLIETALQLFNKNGFHATGIDTILDHAGVARMTLYNHFKSKDALILATVRRRDELFRHWFMRRVERHPGPALDRVLYVFDALKDWISSKDFYGCIFINACAEYSDYNDPVHMAAREHKNHVLKFVQGLVVAANIPDPDQIGTEIMLLMEGAIIMSYVTGDENAASNAKNAAKKLLRHQQ